MLTLPTLSGVFETIYVGNSDVLFKAKTGALDTLQQSVDAGVTWTDVYTFVDNVSIIFQLDNGNIIVGTDSSGVFADPPTEIWTSTDGGTTFTNTLTFVRGGLRDWSYDYRATTVYLAEYGHYDATNVYKSTDGGVTWTTVFTHPNPDDGDAHMHKIHIDSSDINRVWLSAGDGVPVKGLWYTTDGGVTWTKFDDYHQPTWIETNGDDFFLFSDLGGLIKKASITDILADTHILEPRYTAFDDPAVDVGPVAFYSGAIAANGLMFAGGVSYGQASASQNTKNALLVVSQDQGETWQVIKEYAVHPTASTGPAVMSKETSTGLIYIRINGPGFVTEILDTTNPDLLTLPQTHLRTVSKITFGGTAAPI